jgi:Repeat of unknown function (DUF5650)
VRLIVLLIASLLTFDALAFQFDIKPPFTPATFFGARVTVLPNGNFVVLEGEKGSGISANAHVRVHLYTASGSLISTLQGPDNSFVGGSIQVLKSGNFLVVIPFNGTISGSVTWVSATNGLSGTISGANSLIDNKAHSTSQPQVKLLANGDYLVVDTTWSNAGAVSWGSGASGGPTGNIAASNSLVGAGGDDVGTSIKELPNGSYVITAPGWNGGKGAVAFAPSGMPIVGTISAANALVGSTVGDAIGTSVTILTDGNYVASSQTWNGGMGAATFGSAISGIVGVVSSTNSLVGSVADVGATLGDRVGLQVTPLTSGAYVVSSPGWNQHIGAATWAPAGGMSGFVTAVNSLIGDSTHIATGPITALANGNYVVLGQANTGPTATWGNGATGTTGVISISNSLIAQSNPVGEIIAFANSNWLLSTRSFSSTPTDTLTWGSGTAPTGGNVSANNSFVKLHDAHVTDLDTFFAISGQVLLSGLPPTNVVVIVSTKQLFAQTDIVGRALTSTSVIGDEVIDLGDTKFAIVSSGVGAVTYVDPFKTDWTGVCGPANSRTGGAVTQVISFGGGRGLAVVPTWSINTGAATWLSSTDHTGAIDASNSLVGTASGDKFGSDGVTQLSNGRLLIVSSTAMAGKGAVTVARASAQPVGVISASDSLVGGPQYVEVGNGGVVVLPNGNYVVSSLGFLPTSGDPTGVGGVTWGSSLGILGAMSLSNSFVDDQATVGLSRAMGFGGVFATNDSHYVVVSPYWHSGSDYGAITILPGDAPSSGGISIDNSVVGSGIANGIDVVMPYAYDAASQNLIVGRPGHNFVTILNTDRIFLNGYE